MKASLIVIAIPFVLSIMIIGATLAALDFDYQLRKCGELDSSESEYDFDYRLEIDAEYNEKCFYYSNHPLAFPLHIFYGSLLAFLLLILITTVGAFIYIFYQTINHMGDCDY